MSNLTYQIKTSELRATIFPNQFSRDYFREFMKVYRELEEIYSWGEAGPLYFYASEWLLDYEDSWRLLTELESLLDSTQHFKDSTVSISSSKLNEFLEMKNTLWHKKIERLYEGEKKMKKIIEDFEAVPKWKRYFVKLPYGVSRR